MVAVIALLVAVGAIVVPGVVNPSPETVVTASAKLTSNGCPENGIWDDAFLAGLFDVSRDKVR